MSVDLVRVTTSPDSFVAAVVKGMLESAGIPVMLRSYGSAGWLFPGTPGCAGAMDVLVRAEHEAEARALVASAERNADDAGA